MIRVMNDPNQILAEKRARITELESALEVERAELRGMELMAKLIVPSEAFLQLAVGSLKVGGGPARAGAARALDYAVEEASTKGRQPGSISMRWRAVLWRLEGLGGNFRAADIVAVVKELEGREMRPADAKRQMDVYAQHGFVSVENDIYNVTDEFRSKFAQSAQNGSNENAPPSENQDDVLGGADTAQGAQ